MTSKEIKITYQEYDSMDQLSPMDRELVEAAIQATEGSYAPYSKFNVGAAVRLDSGLIVKGSNQENAPQEKFKNKIILESHIYLILRKLISQLIKMPPNGNNRSSTGY